MTRVYLHDYFERNQIADYLGVMLATFKPWIVKNVEKGKWHMDGVTQYSYRFEFEDPQDAVAFKLRFGI